MNRFKNIKFNMASVKKVLIIADLFALLVAMVMISACHLDAPAIETGANSTVSTQTTQTTKPADPTKPCFAKENRRVYKGDTIECRVLNAKDCAVIWESADVSIASVDTEGTVTGVEVGETTICAMVINQKTSERVKLTTTVEVFRKEIPSDSDLPYWYEDEIFLINSKNPVGEDFEPELKNVRKSIPTAHKQTQLTPACEEALAKMYSTFKKQNLGSIRLISTYRSVAKQKELVEKAVKERMKKYGMTEEEARKHALKTRMEPGYSEHHSGLAIDFSTTYATENSFHKTAQGKWLTKNAHKYGFILRYPKDKVSITGINYEPWHFRFIETDHAVEHATYIYEHGLCLEEYVELQYQARAAAVVNARNNPLEAE